ncbi:hypothetical protein R1sor_001809 [Riccia sorocarpa]|uniref:Uncharacterized protein n=1 Tax=Riccia sorocarpa TaxID=122646 RepID=A0ABD3GZI0_9MARC
MAKRKRTPQAPPAAAGRKKKARETPEEASGAGPSQPPRSRPKKGAKRGGQAPLVEEKDPNAVEGPYMVDFEVIPDPDRRIRWGHVPRSARSEALAHLRERSITGSGLSFALDLPVHRPHIPTCLEFIQSAVPVRQERGSRDRLDLPMESTVRGRTVTLDTALVREAFFLPRASLEIKRQVRHSLISDWFAEYQGSGKRYIARTCRRRDWRAALECISMMLLASRRPRTIPGRLTYYIKNFDLDPEEEPEKRLDFAEFMVQSLRREVFAVQAHLKADKPSGVEAAPKKGLDVIICSGKSLVVRPGDCLACTVWGGDRVEAVVPRNNLDKNVKLKGFSRLHDHVICTRDVLLVDTAPERNSRNHPYSRIYPRAVDSFTRASLAVEWLTRFTEWLTTWTENVLPTVDFLRARGHLMDGIFEPMTVLHEFWGETPQPNDRFIIWSDVPAAAREILLTDWPHFHERPERVIEEAEAEEAPSVEEVAATRVEGAPVEEAPLVEEVAATCVEGAPVEEAPPVEEVAATRVEETTQE